MNEIVSVPQLGLSSDRVRLTEWRVQEGDYVEAGAAIAEIETDKASYEVTAPASGHLCDLAVADGEELEVGTQLAVIRSELVKPTASPSSPTPELESERAEPAVGSFERVRAFPAARRRAEALRLDLGSISGSGSSGTVTVADVERAAAEIQAASGEQPHHVPTALEVISSQSWQIPQFWVERTFDLSHCVKYLAARDEDSGRTTLVDVLIAACGRALLEHPCLLRDPQVSSVSVAYLVATSSGLVAPVLQAVDERAAERIGAARRALVERALAGRLSSDDVGPADFTISNLGSVGVDRFMALVVPGQRAILALGRIGSFDGRAGEHVHAVITADHRFASGVDVAMFLRAVAARIENPHELLQLIKERRDEH